MISVADSGNNKIRKISQEAIILHPTANNAVTVSFDVLDFSGASGNAPGAARSINGSFAFYIKSLTGTALLKGTLSPVQLVTDGAGGVTAKVPASALLSFTGVTSTGTTVQGTVNNNTLNILKSGATGTMTLDLSKLLNRVQTIGNTQLIGLIDKPGRYTVEFSFTGLSIGIMNASNNGLANLLPIGSQTTGRAVKGTIITQ